MTATVIPLRQPERDYEKLGRFLDGRFLERVERIRFKRLATVRTSTLIACLANTTDEIERGAIIREIARER